MFSSSFSIKLRKVNTLKKWGPADRAFFFIIQSRALLDPHSMECDTDAHQDMDYFSVTDFLYLDSMNY